MKRIKYLITICLSFLLLCNGVYANNPGLEGSNIDTNSLEINEMNNFAYLLGTGYNGSYKAIGNSPSNEEINPGAINIFGFEDNKLYETAQITQPTGTGPYSLSGLFPVIALKDASGDVSIGTGSDKYNLFFTKYENNKLVGTTNSSNGINLTVDVESIYNNQYIKVNFKMKNNTSSAADFIVGAYSDIQMTINGATTSYLQPGTNNEIKNINNGTNNIGFKLPKIGVSQINYILRNAGTNVTDVDNYWFGDRNSIVNSDTEISKLLSNSNTYEVNATDDDTGIAFSWEINDLASNQEITKSILIGNGIAVLIDEEPKTYDLDNNKDIIFNGDIVNPAHSSSDKYQLYYKLNGNAPVKLGEETSNLEYSLNLKDDAKLNKCGENTVEIYVGDKNDSSIVISNVAEHKFSVTSKTCATTTNPQTGLDTNYIILISVLTLGLGAFIYSRKYNRFPRV